MGWAMGIFISNNVTVNTKIDSFSFVPTDIVDDEGNNDGRSSLRKSKTIDFDTGYFDDAIRAHVDFHVDDFLFF